MNSDRIEAIQKESAYPESVSVQLALLQVWTECEQSKPNYKLIVPLMFVFGFGIGGFYTIVMTTMQNCIFQ